MLSNEISTNFCDEIHFERREKRDKIVPTDKFVCKTNKQLGNFEQKEIPPVS